MQQNCNAVKKRKKNKQMYENKVRKIKREKSNFMKKVIELQEKFNNL